MMVNNGDRVKDRVTGFSGIVVAITMWLNGCLRATIQSDAFKDGLPLDTYCVDVGQLEVLERKVIEPTYQQLPASPSGPMPTPKRPTDPKRQ